jgi:hypothetical protein
MTATETKMDGSDETEGEPGMHRQPSFSILQTNLEWMQDVPVDRCQSTRQQLLCVGDLRAREFHVTLHPSPLPL